MLVPKGSKEGFPMELFVMVSDYKDDAVSTACRYLIKIIEKMKRLSK